VARVLFFPFAPGGGVAHAGACLAVGAELVRAGHEPIVAYGGSRRNLVRGEGIRVVDVPEIAHERTAGSSAARWYDGPADLERFVHRDREVIERLRPDVVVVDLRLSASIAAELAGVPTLLLMHFLRLTPHFRERSRRARRLRELRRLHRIPIALRRALTRDAHGGAVLERVVSDARTRLGVPPDAGLWNGSLVACTTTPLLDPAELPPTWRYVGPISWSPSGGAVPVRGARPLVYVTQGTTGSAALLRRAVTELRGEPVDLVVGTGDESVTAGLRELAPNAAVHAFVASDECLALADAAVIHGGHGTASQAHAAGVPVVVIPHRADQWAWADRVEELGTGIALRPPLVPGAVRRALRRVLTQSRYRDAARAVARDLAQWDGAGSAARLAAQLAA
jgi:MGT family glycosyltransferase